MKKCKWKGELIKFSKWPDIITEIYSNNNFIVFFLKITFSYRCIRLVERINRFMVHNWVCDAQNVREQMANIQTILKGGTGRTFIAESGWFGIKKQHLLFGTEQNSYMSLLCTKRHKSLATLVCIMKREIAVNTKPKNSGSTNTNVEQRKMKYYK